MVVSKPSAGEIRSASLEALERLGVSVAEMEVSVDEIGELTREPPGTLVRWAQETETFWLPIAGAAPCAIKVDFVHEALERITADSERSERF